MKIDVAIPTWNSALHLRKCIRKIRKNVPVNNIIIVDRFSQDDTLRICENFGCKIIQSGANLGTARRICIDHVKTEIFAFIDSDYILCDGWFDKLVGYFDDDVGAVSGRHRIISPCKHYEHYRSASMSRNEFAVLEYGVGKGGGTENTLIRTWAVSDVEMPANVSGREDWVIAEHVKAKGLRWLNAPVVSVHHTADPYKQQLWAGGGARRLNASGVGVRWPLVRSVLSLFLQAAYWVIRPRGLPVVWMLLRLNFNLVSGYIRSYDYVRG